MDNPELTNPACPTVAPYGSVASVDQPGMPPLTFAVPGADDARITPPPPPPPGPWRFPGKGVPGGSAGQVPPPLPPAALAVSPASEPLFANTRIVPPAPAPPPPSFSVCNAVWPLEVIVPVPVTEPGWITTSPPPAVPLL